MNKCINCKKEAMELHHIVPLSLGGNDIDSNKVWLCVECHNKIHNRNLGVGALAAQSKNFRRAVQEHRVGRPAAEKTPAFEAAYDEWKAGKINATEAIKKSGVCRATFYKLIKI